MLHAIKNSMPGARHPWQGSLLAACLIGAIGSACAKAQFVGFGAFESYDMDSSALHSISTADVNDDGRLDVVMASNNGNRVFILLNQPNGSFISSSMTITKPVDVEVADIDNDGTPDVVVLSNISGTMHRVEFFLGTGNGAFHHAGFLVAPTNSKNVTIADFNADGVSDIAVAATAPSASQVTTYIGTGALQFELMHVAPTLPFPRDMIAMDATGDGLADVVFLASANGIGFICVLKNDGGGVLVQSAAHQVGDSPSTLTAADANHDGVLDVSTANYFSGYTSILLANGAGGFLPQIVVTPAPVPGFTGTPTDIQFPDLDGDGVNDMVISTHHQSQSGQERHRLDVYRGTIAGAMTYQSSYEAPAFILGMRFFESNGDYSPDLFAALTDSVVAVSTNLTPLAPPASFELLSPPNGATGLLTPGAGPSWPGVPALLDWSDSAAFHRTYEVQIQRMGPSELVVHNAIGLTESRYEIPGGVLQAGVRYQWTVLARNSVGTAAPHTVQVFEFTTAVPSDLNGDGAVNGADLANLLSNWGVLTP